MALGMGLAMGGGAILGLAQGYAAKEAKEAEVAYAKKVKKTQDRLSIKDLRKANHDAVIAKEELRVQTLRGKAAVSVDMADALSDAIVQQAASGVYGNTANRVHNALYSKGADASTLMDLEARAEEDNIEGQLDALATKTERQLAGGQVVDFSTGFGTFLSMASGVMGGVQAGMSAYQGYKNLQTS